MWIKQYFEMPEALQQAGLSTFEQAMNLQGKVFRSVVGRKTMQVNIAGKSYFVKQHFGVGWAEIVKNLLTFKTPILGAMTEVSAIQKLTEIGIDTTPLVAHGQQGCNPASMRSFIITEDLGDIDSLEDLCADWLANPPDAALKQKIIIAMAQLAAKLHSAGLCHRDFYLCHFALKKAELAQGEIKYYLLDLHRMLHSQKTNSSAVMKDIAGLYFSMLDFDFSTEDLGLFKQHYLLQSSSFWAKVEARANKLYSKFHSEKFQKRLTKENSKRD
jgi:UDP-glucose:(heptosyl)LPS alpha-1,3-glucosyltransferase/heptose I phosphotransferase